MAAPSTRFEIRIDARDEDGNSSHFLHSACSGPADIAEVAARAEFERVKRAMQGHDESLYADHFVTATLLKGDTAETSSTPNQEVVETYTKEG